MRFVCPVPPVWARVHQALQDAWEKHGRTGPPPPMPLILAGWAFSNDQAKHARWEESVRWAESRGLITLIPELGPTERYEVEELSTYDVGPLGGPMYLPWSADPKPVPSPETLVAAMNSLNVRWYEVAGRDLAARTRPLRFTGKKGRRLVVGVAGEEPPPWGGWTYLDQSDIRRRFTDFRARLNNVIKPHFVDHVDFTQQQ